MRPPFERVILGNVSDVVDHLRAALRSADGPCKGLVVGKRIEVTTKDRDRRFWSPELRVEARATDRGCSLRGRFGPKPEVWVLFVVLYAHIGFVCLASLIWGTSQMMMGTPAWAFWGTPLALVAAGMVFLAARLGQRLGRAEMQTIGDFLDGALLDLVTEEQKRLDGDVPV